MTADYRDGRCCAITRRGTRCTGRWAVAAPCIISADQDTGTFVGGPNIVLCHRHRHLVYRSSRTSICDGKTRAPVVHRGWLGSANAHGYGAAVFAAPTGWKVAPWWLAHARTEKFSESRRDCP